MQETNIRPLYQIVYAKSRILTKRETHDILWDGEIDRYNRTPDLVLRKKNLISCRFSLLHDNKMRVGCPRGVMVKAIDCGIVVSEFVLQSRYYVHFRANALGKGKNPLIFPAMD